MGERQTAWQCSTEASQKLTGPQSGDVGSKLVAGRVHSSALKSFGVRTWIVPVAGSLPIISGVALILRIQEKSEKSKTRI
jgi:hypothetical protein